MSLRQHLTQQQQRLQDLLSLLEQEQRELSSGTINGEQLQVLAQQKQELQQQLEQAETQRRKAQQKLGYSNDAAGAKAAAAAAGCAEVWQQLLATTQRVAQLNQLNGELIQHRLHHNQHMLNILQDAAGTSGSLYGADGNQFKTPSRINSKA
ncbi:MULTISPECIES: flagellar protein FlgN [Idiomarinaceae]|uniref:Flagella synthesis protein FlgN n=3 Tax=Pseudidiomarina TaxID=2800384 RepID=A0A368UWC0_9GAMM|nr:MULTISPECIES: flagellar protein FlgN [Idiomarinaceae]MDT7526607.1 flagellar protein FlgN [Pseudidiomarina sp. GXY010]MDX1526799.1 flagellar protein FlgN [Pseudidiomarina maritima]MRJ42080.1 flagellar protein FlgN [Idiomarina sp. FeN1]NCU57005.1 flagellar protein FlgN [Idiomarina sp. FenA--70]NCU59714.1 flagellar protein FlgN [Idiomarina sp. FenBw--71]